MCAIFMPAYAWLQVTVYLHICTLTCTINQIDQSYTNTFVYMPSIRCKICWCFYYSSNRCQIAVHQECYGARNVQDFTSWVCRSCETPDIERECCLCPVKGMKFMSNICTVHCSVYLFWLVWYLGILSFFLGGDVKIIRSVLLHWYGLLFMVVYSTEKFSLIQFI